MASRRQRRKAAIRSAGPVQPARGSDDRVLAVRDKLAEVLQTHMRGLDDDTGTSILGSCLITAGIDALLFMGFEPSDIADFFAEHMARVAAAEAAGEPPPNSVLLPAGPENGPANKGDKPS